MKIKCKECSVFFVKIPKIRGHYQVFCSELCRESFFKEKRKLDMRKLRKLNPQFGQKWKKENIERYNLYSLFYQRKYREKYRLDGKPRIEPLKIINNNRKEIIINFYTDMSKTKKKEYEGSKKDMKSDKKKGKK